MPGNSDSAPLNKDAAVSQNEMHPKDQLPGEDRTTNSAAVSQHETDEEVLWNSAACSLDETPSTADSLNADPIDNTAAYDEFLRSQSSASAGDHDFMTVPENAVTLRMLHDVLRSGSGNHSARTDNAAGNRDHGAVPERSHERLSIGDAQVIGTSAEFSRPGMLPDRFRVTALLGKGGFGAVFRATDSLLCREVAIKIPHTEISTSEDFRERFLRESRAASRLNHPSIVRILEVSEQFGNAFQVAEFVDGCRLTERLRTTPVQSFRESAWTIARLADAVHHAHLQGVLHRDIKPDNILLEKISLGFEFRLPRLTDFGLARIVDDQMMISRSGMLLGTPRYMSPEQLSGDPALHTAATDIYSLGAVLYEMLARVPPFQEVTTLTRRVVTAGDLPKPLQRQRPDIPRDLASICMKCMAIRPGDRYQSAESLRTDLERFLDGRPTVARPLPLHEQIWRWARREKLLSSLVTTVLVSALLITAVLWQSKSESDRKNQQLSAAFNALREESDESKRLREITEQHRVEAENGRRLYRDLSWRNGIQKAFAALQQKDLRGSFQSMRDLAESHGNAESKVEWQLLSSELKRHYLPLQQSAGSWTEVRQVPGRTWIAASNDQGRILIYDLQTHQPVAEYPTGIQSIHALAVSPDGQQIAAGGSVDDQIRSKVILLELASGKHLKDIHRMPTTVESLAYSPDGRQLACGCRYEFVSVIDLETEEITKISSTARNEWLGWNADGSHLALQTDKPTISVYETAEGQPASDPLRINLPINIRAACWLGNHSLIASVSYNGREILISDTSSGTLVSRVRIQPEGVDGVYCSPSGGYLLTSHSDGTVGIWKMQIRRQSDQSIINPLSAVPGSEPNGEAPLPLPESPVELSYESSVDAASLLQLSANYKVEYEKINSVCFSDERTAILASNAGSLIQLQFPDALPDLTAVDGKDTEHCHSGCVCERSGEVFFSSRSGDISEVSLSSLQSERPALSSESGRIALGSGAAHHLIPTGAPLLDQIQISPSGLILAATSVDGRVVTFHRKSTLVPFQEPAATLIPPQISLSEVEEDGYVTDAITFSGSEDKIIRIHDSRSLEAIRIGSEPSEAEFICALPGPGMAVAASPDDSVIVAGGGFQGLVAVDPSGGVTRKLPHRGDTCAALLFTSSTEFISVHKDGSLRFWNLNADESRAIPAHRSAINTLVYLKDREIGFSVDQTGTVVLWRTDPIELIGELTSIGLSTGGQSPRLMPSILTFPSAGGLNLGVMVNHRPTGTFLYSWSAAAHKH
jgi:serine/threonine protein kinase/WD40 repeat protein